MQTLETPVVPLPPRLLAAIAIDYALFETFASLGDPPPGERTFERVLLAESHDIWLIRWAAGSSTELHDHGGSAGALYVVNGDLVELRPNPAGVGRSIRRELHEFEYRSMSPTHIHTVANESQATATSVHVYSPPLSAMQHFETRDDSELRRVRREVVGESVAGPDTFTPTSTVGSHGAEANG